MATCNSRQFGMMQVCNLVRDIFILQNEKHYHVISHYNFVMTMCKTSCFRSLWVLSQLFMILYWDNNYKNHCGQCEDEEHVQILDLFVITFHHSLFLQLSIRVSFSKIKEEVYALGKLIPLLKFLTFVMLVMKFTFFLTWVLYLLRNSSQNRSL